MSGSCIVIDSIAGRRTDLSKVARRYGLSAFTYASPDKMKDLSDMPSPVRLAFVAIEATGCAGLALISRLNCECPESLIIAIDSVDSEDSAARAIEAGAHDVLRLPFRLAEAAARVKLGMGRIAIKQSSSLLPGRQDLIERLDLTQAEANILRIFSDHQGEIVSREELSQRLYGTSWKYGDRRFDVYVTRLRRKLKSAFKDKVELRTIRSAGYMLESSI